MTAALSTTALSSTEPSGGGGRRAVRICDFNTWAKQLTESTSYLHAVPKLDLKPLVSNASDAALLTKDLLDCDR